MFTKSVVFVAVCVLGCLVAAKVTCNPLANCKTCVDETHCDTCPENYILGSDSVCRYNCSIYGAKCTSCTAEKCICEQGKKWNSTRCVPIEECTDDSPKVCPLCGVGFDLIDPVSGKCTTCTAVFGEGCSECSDTKCTKAKDGYVICGAKAQQGECNVTVDSFPGCTALSGNACGACVSSAKLVSGACQYKLPTCNKSEVVLNKGGIFICGTCQSFDENCVGDRCTSTGCTVCKTGYTVTSEGKCINCTSQFTGCGFCQEDACVKCSSSSWILTPNGCFNQNPYVRPSNVNGGLIAGIVIAAIVLVCVIILAIYCVVTSTSKHGRIDPSLYEEDLQFKSSSVL